MRKIKLAILGLVFSVFLPVLLSAQPVFPVMLRLRDLRDVSKTVATDGQLLAYVSATGLWTPATGSGGAPTDAHYLTDQAESGLSAEVVVTANGKSLITAANYAAMRTLLDLESGTDFNAYDLDLTTYAGITPSANAQTILGETFAQMLTSIAASPLAGSSSIVTVGTLSAGDATGVVSASSTTVAGKVEIAIASEVSAGTDATRAVSPDSLAGSVFGTKTMILKVMAEATVVTSGDGKMYVTIPAELNGMNLVSIGAHIYTADTAQNMDIDLYNFTDSQDMLSTAMRIESTETDTISSAQPGTINATYDDVATGDVIRIDVTTFTGTVGAGLEIRLGFQLP